MDDERIALLVAFLQTLTDRRYENLLHRSLTEGADGGPLTERPLIDAR